MLHARACLPQSVINAVLVVSEEQNDLAKLEKAMPREESESLAKSFQRCKHFVPTRSHPSAPDKGGLFETAAGLAMVSGSVIYCRRYSVLTMHSMTLGPDRQAS